MNELEYIVSGLPDKTIPTPWCVLEVNPKVPTFRVLVAMFKEKAEAELFIDAKKHGVLKPEISIKENNND